MNAAQRASGCAPTVPSTISDDVWPSSHAIRHARSDGLCSRDAIARAVDEAELVIGAVLVPGAAAPKLVTREMLKTMKRGSVLVDIAIDQGGCFETSKPTTHDDPVYEVDGVIHYCVAKCRRGRADLSVCLNNRGCLLREDCQFGRRGSRRCGRTRSLANGLHVRGQDPPGGFRRSAQPGYGPANRSRRVRLGRPLPISAATYPLLRRQLEPAGALASSIAPQARASRGMPEGLRQPRRTAAPDNPAPAGRPGIASAPRGERAAMVEQRIPSQPNLIVFGRLAPGVRSRVTHPWCYQREGQCVASEPVSE